MNISYLSERLAEGIRTHRRTFVAAVLGLSLVVWAAVGASIWFMRGVVTSLPDREALHNIGTMAQATTLVDVNGTPAFTIFREQRIEVPLSAMSPHLIRAVIAVEDQRFYDHGGVDIVRVAGAALNNIREGRASQGGSTITQQLARQSFLTMERTYHRKVTEVIVAARLEKQLEKDEILELYLNKVYFGDGLYGVEAASLGFFGTHASELDVPQAALLAGLVKSPSTYAPTVNLERAVARRNVVLQAMRDSQVLDNAAYEAAIDAPVELDDSLGREEAYGQYFKEEVRKQLVQQFGWERVYQGGLRVYTTLDLDMQKAAETEVARALTEIGERQARALRRGQERDADADPLQAALVALDPATGEVRALVGGRSFAESHFNRATQARRQPGSAFKPFIYAAALERGFSPATLITNLDAPIETLQGAWVPEDEHLESESMTMRTALRTSSNRAAVQMLDQVGLPVTVRYVERFGMGTVPSVPSLALGSGEVTLLSMTAAFGAFANEGMRPTPSLIRRVETTGGEVLYTGAQAPERAISEETAFLMASMLADVVNSGTGWPARRVGFTLPAAGKTGTTNDYHDAWFVGFTPTLVAGVWVGYDQPRPIVANGYAGEIAVPIWGRFMKTATDGDKPDWYRAPKTVGSATICRLSGKLATSACHDVATIDDKGILSHRSMAYTEHFVRGTEPDEYCPIHGLHTAGTLAALARGAGTPQVPSVATSGSASSAPAAAVTAASAEAEDGEAEASRPAAEPDRRRGFWSRIFGRRDRDRDREEERDRDRGEQTTEERPAERSR